MEETATPPAEETLPPASSEALPPSMPPAAAAASSASPASDATLAQPPTASSSGPSLPELPPMSSSTSSSSAAAASAAPPPASQNPTQSQESLAQNQDLTQSLPQTQSAHQQQRPSLSRMRPQSPYTLLAQQLPSSSSSSSFPAPSPSSSLPSTLTSPSLVQRGSGPAIGVPAVHPRAQQPPMAFSPFGPSSSYSQPFGQLHRATEQSPTSNAQARQPVPRIHNIGMVGSLSTTQMRANTTPVSQQQRLGHPQVRSVPSSANQALNSQNYSSHGLSRAPSVASPNLVSALQQSQQHIQQPLESSQGSQIPSPSMPSSSYKPQQPQQVSQQKQPIQQQQQQKPQPQHPMQHGSHEQHLQQHQALRSQQIPLQHQAVRTPGSTAQRSGSHLLQSGSIQSRDNTLFNADAAEPGNRILSKRSIREMVAQIDPSEKLDSEVEDVLIEVAENFIESVVTFGCSLAKHRKSGTLEAKDILLHVERSWNITLPGFGGDEIKCYKKPHANDIHRERLAVIKKSMAATSDASNAKNSSGQAAANQKGHTPKAPMIGSPPST